MWKRYYRGFLDNKLTFVSVPLRGLIMWKLQLPPRVRRRTLVSVPLRGLIMWKPIVQNMVIAYMEIRFSPLTGINYVET